MGCREVIFEVRKWRSLIIAVMIPILAAPLPIIVDGPEAKCGYSLIIIAIYWVTEIIPLAVTSLLPMVLFPLFGIMKASDVSMAYFKETLMLFLGSLIVAVAVEKWNLHKRLALRTLTLVGPQPKWLLLGVIFPTWFLSMWMSNTATAAMMMPIVSAILLQIKACQERDDQEKRSLMGSKEKLELSASNVADDGGDKDVEQDQESPPSVDREREFLSFAKTFSLVVAYSANIGGVATLTGTPPNVIFKGLADGIYRNASSENPVNFANWTALGLPLSFILVTLLWFWMIIHMEGVKCLKFWRKDPTNYDSVRDALRLEYKKLGNMCYAETSVAVCFVIMACLWITRKPGFIPGWGDLFEDKYVGDSTPAILTAVLLFILPAHPPNWADCCKTTNKTGHDDKRPLAVTTSYKPLLEWSTVHNRMAWGVLLLMGGGFALAEGCEKSGLSAWVSSNLNGLSHLPTWTIVLVLTIMIAMATEVTSNAATTTLFIPIVGKTAISMGVNPLVFMIPCTIASSLAFLLPVATPPNAIVFAAGYLSIKDMVLCGIPMNILSVVTLNIMMNSWAIPVYNLDVLEDAFKKNITSSLNTSMPALMDALEMTDNSTLIQSAALSFN